ncbi:MAG TPA: hypothetical protein VEA59_01780 [Patescibacteria group bacterium]|nr:hypothetical protein [Patescibacteria group bacterium]
MNLKSVLITFLLLVIGFSFGRVYYNKFVNPGVRSGSAFPIGTHEDNRVLASDDGFYIFWNPNLGLGSTAVTIGKDSQITYLYKNRGKNYKRYWRQNPSGQVFACCTEKGEVTKPERKETIAEAKRIWEDYKRTQKFQIKDLRWIFDLSKQMDSHAFAIAEEIKRENGGSKP